MDQDNIISLAQAREEREAFILELQRLLESYQYASHEDRVAVWSILNKYAPLVDADADTDL